MTVKPAQTASERLKHIVKVERSKPLHQAEMKWKPGAPVVTSNTFTISAS